MTIKAKLLAQEHELMGYIVYVFQNLDDSTFGHKYVMCVRLPNWQCSDIEIGEVGFLEYKAVEAGKDSWFDGVNFIPYKYTNIYFMRFIREKQDNSKIDIII